MNVLEVEDLTVSYKGTPAVWSVDFSIPKGSFVGIVGPNGSGKSTLLKALVGLLPLETGRIRYFGGQSLGDARKRFAYLPQRESIDWDFPINVLDTVLMGVYPRIGFFRRPGRKDRDWALECLRNVGMEDFHRRQISELSGGQQQRVFLARALAQDAELYFFDEPFSAVDAKTEQTIMTVIGKLRSEGRSVVVVHHDLFSVAENTDRVLLMNTRLIKSGPTKEVMTREFLEAAYGGQLESFAQVLFEGQKRS